MKSEKESLLLSYKSRYQRLSMNGKNTPGQGVMRKLERKIRKLESELKE